LKRFSGTTQKHPVRFRLFCCGSLCRGAIPLAKLFLRNGLLLFAMAPALWSWSPIFHEVQTKLASRMVPAPMAALLHAQRAVLLQAGRGQSSDEPPTVEQVVEQFNRILALSEGRLSQRQLAHELGILAHMVQVLTDPGATQGVTPLRTIFSDYADENLGRMILTRQPAWAVTASIDPKPKILAWTREKFDRHALLLDHFDQQRNARIGDWDELSMPFAQLQLSFSGGVHATANLWILLWRAAGDRWLLPSEYPSH
jgi:hypothetical protein